MKDANVVVKLPKKSDDHPVAMLVQIASRYESRIYMADGPRKVNAKSIIYLIIYFNFIIFSSICQIKV